jgi:outer membrane protein OmpA-like peptidoglycan-associated protein
MKKILLLVASLLLICGTASAQGLLKNLGERAKNAVENNLGNKVEQGVNKALDGVLGGNKKNNDKSADRQTVAADEEEIEEAAPKEEAVDFAEIQAKSDFKRGENVFFTDDLSGEQMGEFPSKWDLLSGSSVEVVNILGRKAIRIEGSRIRPLMEEEEYLPEEFTIEFDVLAQPAQEGSGWDATLDLAMDGAENRRVFDIRMSPEYHPYYGNEYNGISWGWGAENPNGNKMDGAPGTQVIKKYLKKNDWNHIAISFNKRAFKMYLNYQRIVNIPNMIQPRKWWIDGSSDSDKGIFVTNIVMAKGAVELYERNATDYSSAVEKAIAETGKFVTNNILFETGKATLKPESMEEIQKVADYMKKNPTARFEVQGHTDNQGSDAVNDPLSQQRAEAVVKALESQGVDPFNLRPVGKGSHEPVADNSTDEGRAKNRRVEFIKK